MLLSEIKNWVFVESGQFLLGSFDATLIDNAKFWTMTKRALVTYNQYKSRTIRQTISISSSKVHQYIDAVSATGIMDEILTIVCYPGSTGNITITLVDGATAGSEVVVFDYDTSIMTVTIEDGVSTQLQIANAIADHHLVYTAIGVTSGAAWTLGVGTDTVTLEDGADSLIPEWVSKVIPVDINLAMSSLLRSNAAMSSLRSDPLGVGVATVPAYFDWRYNSPKLYVSESGYYDISEQHNHLSELRYDTNNELDDVNLPSISMSDRYFLDLVLGRFLMSIGKSRRAFTINDLPITTDASELVSEGKELLDTTLEVLRDTGDWWRAIS